MCWYFSMLKCVKAILRRTERLNGFKSMLQNGRNEKNAWYKTATENSPCVSVINKNKEIQISEM